MEMTNKQAKMWVFMLVVVLLFAVIILGIDFAMKGAILEESLRLREVIEGEEVARLGRKANANGAATNVPNDSTLPRDVLGVFPAGMEKRGSNNGGSKPPKKTGPRRSNSPANSDTPDFPSGA